MFYQEKPCLHLELGSKVTSKENILKEKEDRKNYAYSKYRTEGFDDYFTCRTINCKQKHVRNWLNLFVDYHNSELNEVE